MRSICFRYRRWMLSALAGVIACVDDLDPVQVTPPITPTLVELSAGAHHTCALTSEGAAYCWGNNGYGQVGNGTTGDAGSGNTANLWIPIPTLVTGGVRFTAVSAGGAHSCGLTAAGAVYCWGYNAWGQLGDGTGTVRSSPVLVTTNVRFAAVSAGYYHTCALTAEGAAYCWGWNPSGQLGDGTGTDRTQPVPVTGGLSFASVWAGGWVSASNRSGAHTCGVTITGAAYCWGLNSSVQLGDGTTTNRSSPVRVGVAMSFANVSAGDAHSCGVTAVGAVHCWGSNFNAQLGDGTTNGRLSPVMAAAGMSLATVKAGGGYSCGLAASGIAYCWGRNDWGQLGDGSRTDRLTPVPVMQF